MRVLRTCNLCLCGGGLLVVCRRTDSRVGYSREAGFGDRTLTRSAAARRPILCAIVQRRIFHLLLMVVLAGLASLGGSVPASSAWCERVLFLGAAEPRPVTSRSRLFLLRATGLPGSRSALCTADAWSDFGESSCRLTARRVRAGALPALSAEAWLRGCVGCTAAMRA